MNQREFAKRLGMSPSYVSDIMRERRPLSAPVALGIELVLGLSASKLLYLQADAQLNRIRKDSRQ